MESCYLVIYDAMITKIYFFYKFYTILSKLIGSISTLIKFNDNEQNNKYFKQKLIVYTPNAMNYNCYLQFVHYFDHNISINL